MSVDSTLDTAFTTLLGKFPRGGGANLSVAGDNSVVPTTGTGLVTVNITFSGGGGNAMPLSGMPGSVEIPGPLTLVAVHLFAGDELGVPTACSASVDLRLTSEGAFGTSSAIYGLIMPALSNAATASLDLFGWVRNFATADTILYRLDSFSGDATWLTVTMQMRPNAASVPT